MDRTCLGRGEAAYGWSGKDEGAESWMPTGGMRSQRRRSVCLDGKKLLSKVRPIRAEVKNGPERPVC